MPVFLLSRVVKPTLAIVLWLLPPHSLAETFSHKLVAAALERTEHQVRYDGRYLRIAYPNGDVPADIGVCTDVVIRSYRALGIDLQQLVHEDMRADFDLYPSKRIWGLTKPDSNIDHRRVPNLQTFFSRYGEQLALSRQGIDYQPGDLVTWLLPGNLPHIGIVTDKRSTDGKRLMLVRTCTFGHGSKIKFYPQSR
uniref:DUF1287 domain-containing protein n=1 Tax=Rheinheimera sp. TaxID=1869214 RepID=UPI0040480ADF